MRCERSGFFACEPTPACGRARGRWEDVGWVGTQKNSPCHECGDRLLCAVSKAQEPEQSDMLVTRRGPMRVAACLRSRSRPAIQCAVPSKAAPVSMTPAARL